MDQIKENEPFSRYLFSKSDYSSQKNKVKYRAFMPSIKDNETFVFRIDHLVDKEIWEMGDREIVPIRKKAILARADIKVKDILKNQLQVLPDEPPPRHAIIINWPGEKSEQQLMAGDLALKAKLVINDFK